MKFKFWSSMTFSFISIQHRTWFILHCMKFKVHIDFMIPTAATRWDFLSLAIPKCSFIIFDEIGESFSRVLRRLLWLRTSKFQIETWIQFNEVRHLQCGVHIGNQMRSKSFKLKTSSDLPSNPWTLHPFILIIEIAF